jgi:hypothetical protein
LVLCGGAAFRLLQWTGSRSDRPALALDGVDALGLGHVLVRSGKQPVGADTVARLSNPRRRGVRGKKKRNEERRKVKEENGDEEKRKVDGIHGEKRKYARRKEEMGIGKRKMARGNKGNGEKRNGEPIRKQI